MRTLSRDDGFSLTELMIATTVMLLVLGSALTTVRNAVMVNDSASQLADANQNLRAGTNTLIRDLLMAGRIIGASGISMPGGMTFNRPGPPCPAPPAACPPLTFDLISSDDPNDPTKQMPSITTGYQQGPTINNSPTDIVTILTVDEFMPVVSTPPINPSAPSAVEGTISADGTKVTFATNSLWINGDASNPVTNPNGADTPKIQIGDLVFFQGQYGNAIQTVTAKDATSITFGSGDWFNFNPVGGATNAANKPMYQVKQIGFTPTPASLTWPPGATAAPPGMCYQQAPSAATPFCAQVTLFKVAMVTYYVDNTDTTTPRLTRQLNHAPTGCTTSSPPSDTCPAKFQPQALAGIVEDLDLTYDVYDGTCNPTAVTFSRASMPWTVTCGTPAVSLAYTENMIRKVNVHVGVRSEAKSKPVDDYVRNHISTSVNVRSLTAVDRYNTQVQ